MIRYYAHKDDYLEMCRCYRAIYDTPSIQEDPAKWGEVRFGDLGKSPI